MTISVEEVIAPHSNGVQVLFRAIREIMLNAHDDIEEEFLGGSKVKMGYYSIGNRNNPVGVIGPGVDHVKVFFHHYANVDTEGLLLEGSGKHSRHVKFRPGDDLDQIEQILIDVCAISSDIR